MKLSKVLLLLALLMLGVSCSSKRNKDDATKSVDFSQEVSAEDADFIVDSEDEDLLLDENDLLGVEEVAMSETAEPSLLLAEDEPVIAAETSNSNIMIGGQYTVERGDTLMWVAFKLYGDYKKWHHLSSLNGNIAAASLAPGMVLNHDSAGFDYNPQGLPHLIKVGENLGSISGEKYGTDKRWREIWDNNKAMIQDPNIIFAGFTLHYLPDRDIASEEF